MIKFNSIYLNSCKKERKSVILFYAFIMLYALYANITWHLPGLLCVFFQGVVSFFLIYINKSNITRQKKNLIVLAILAILICSVTQNFIGKIANFLSFLPFLAFICLKDDRKLAIFNAIENILVAIFAISAICWGGYLSGVNFFPGRHEMFNEYNFINYFFFVAPANVYTLIPRFQSIFIEPGYIGSLLALLLYIHNFNLKDWKCVVYLVSLIMTFSLAGYLIAITGFVWNKLFLNGTNKLKSFFLLLIATGGLFCAINFNDGDNIVNNIVFSRLEPSADGTIRQNRTTDDFDAYFDRFITSEKALFGDQETYNQKYKDSDSVGIKVFIVMNGLVGLVSYLLMLFILLKNVGISKKSIGMLALFLLFFVRGHLFSFSPFFLIVLYQGLSNQYSEKVC